MLRFRLARVSLLLLLSVLAACDTDDPADPLEVTFGGVTYTALGQATVNVSGGGLVVGNIGDSGDDGVRVERASGITRGAFLAEPVNLPDGGRWGMQVFGTLAGERTALATAWAEALDDRHHELTFDFAQGLGIAAVTFEYFLRGELVLSVPDVPLLGGGGRAARAASAGEGENDPESVHVVRDGGVIIVATDYESSAAATGAGCSAALLTLAFPGLPETVCTDFVRAVPQTASAFPEATSLEVRARTLPQFTLTSGEVE